MSAASPKLIKELREKSGAGMLDCKKALIACDGDIEEAIKHLREAGLSKAAKKSSNVAAEGLVSMLVNDDKTKVTMVELNSQTDFVAKNENTEHATIISVIDNIGRGASGQAVQNMNIICGFEETLGLELPALWP